MPNATTHPETLVIVSTQVREPGQLDSPWLSGEQPSLEAIQTAVGTVKPSEPMVFGGGEPTLRSDFLELVQLLPPEATLATDGLALHQRPLIARLVDEGLSKVRIPFHSARADAHNWLVGIPGAHKRVCGAMSTMQEHGIQVTAEVTLTRPTMPYLEETVAFLYRSGIRHVGFRMLEREGASTDAYITLAPRIGLLEPALEAALLVALRHDMKVTLQGLPHCASPRFSYLHRGASTIVTPAGVDAPHPTPSPSGGCGGCTPECPGAPKAYVDVFGWTEFGSVKGDMPADNHPVSKPGSGPDVPAPPPRANRSPSTRVVDAVTQSMRHDLDGDPVIGLPAQTAPSVIAVRFPSSEATRTIKKRLVQASQQGADTLQIIGDLEHPQALDLLREALRLSFPRVVYSGDITGLKSAPKNKLFQLRGLRLVQVPADKENLEIAAKLHATASVPVEAYLTLDGSTLPEWLPGWWAAEGWPGTPRFAVAQGADLSSLQVQQAQMPDCSEKEALDIALQPGTIGLFGSPGTQGIVMPDKVGWPKVPSFTVE
jgi:hypothetical protein